MCWRRMIFILAIVCLGTATAAAQEGSESSLVVSRPSVQTADLFLRADQLSFDSHSNRLITEGNVEIRCSNHILRADRIAFDGGTNRLVAEGNIRLNDPKGNIIRAQRYRLHDNFRDTFWAAFKTAIKDKRVVPAPK